ncbi:MAG: hypothetical protein ACJA1H_000652 [Glaciecola sp.]|jgi:hypothetical protein
MNTITKQLVLLFLCLIVSNIEAQNTKQDSTKTNIFKNIQIEKLEKLKESITNEERGLLKNEVEAINRKLDANEITADEAEKLKTEAAKKRALNIEDRLAIIDTKIALINRNDYENKNFDEEVENISITLGSKGLLLDLAKKKREPPKYDIRTTNKLLFAIGFNNAIGDNQSLDDSPYELGGSGFVEMGWIWQTRILENSNFARINYGFSFQWNKLNIKDNRYFVQDGNVTTLQEFPVDLKKSQFRVTNLVVPVHFEFGPSKKRDYKDRLRYTTDNHFRIGIGGYGGVRLSAQHKLKFEENGDNVKDKIRKNYNTSNFVYGLSAYVGVGDISLYAKYDLNPLFKDQEFDQHNLSLGLRFDLD